MSMTARHIYFRKAGPLAAVALFFALGASVDLKPQTTQSLAPVLGTVATAASSWSTTVATLGQSDGLLSVVAIPSTALTAAPGTAAWQEEGAGLLLASANFAGANNFSTRRGQLLQSAEQYLLSALQLGPATGADRARCVYLLGWLAERLHNDVPSAAAYYQQAVAADATNTQAANALARVNAILAFRQSLSQRSQ